jgi:hypothetical protein
VAKPPAGANYTTTVRKAIAYHHVQQVLDPVKARKNARVVKPSLVLEQLRLAMTGTVSDPVVLLWSRPLTAGHAVTPYALEGRTGSQWRVWIYDNESPGMSQLYVDFDTVKETWSYWWGPVSGTETTKNLATVAISEFAKRPVFPSGAGGGLSAAGPATTSPSGLVWMSGGGHLRITDSQGRQIGFVGDVFLHEIPGAYETPLSAASDGGMEPLYTLPLTETYTILIDGQTLTESGAVDVTQFGPGYAAWVEDVTLAPTSQEALVIANDGTQLAYSSNEGQEATLTLALDDVDQSHQLQIQGADVGAGQVVSLTAETGIGHVAFSSAQAGGGEYNLEVIRASAAGEQRFFHMGLIIAAADTHYADYGAWDGSGPMTLYVDHGSDGSIDETWELANHANRVYLPVVFRSG